MRRSVPLALAILAAGLALFLAPAAAQGPIFGTITGPNALAPSQVSAYNLTINGGPTGAVSYTVRWHLTGPNVAGGLPSAASPTTATGNRTTFSLNLTAPAAEQTMTLVVQISAAVGSTYEAPSPAPGKSRDSIPAPRSRRRSTTCPPDSNRGATRSASRRTSMGTASSIRRKARPSYRACSTAARLR